METPYVDDRNDQFPGGFHEAMSWGRASITPYTSSAAFRAFDLANSQQFS